MEKDCSQIGDWKCIKLDEVDSTNAYAKQMIQDGLQEKTVIVTDVQTKGYGRSTHSWESSNNKGLWFSAVISVDVNFEELAQSTLVLAVAVQNAIKQATGIDLLIKWPNDLLSSQGKKCAGLLVECASTTFGDAKQACTFPKLVLGVGLNVTQKTTDFSQGINDVATSLYMLGAQETSKFQLLRCILKSIDQCFLEWQRFGFSIIRKQWLENSHTIGKAVKLSEGFDYQEGIAVGMSEAGALEVRAQDGTIFCVDSGEVFLKT